MLIIKSLMLVLSLLALVRVNVVGQVVLTSQQYEEDFDYAWQSVADSYAYFDVKETDWNAVRELYRPMVKNVRTRGEFVSLLESVIEELYDFHAHLNANTASSPRLVPSGADIWGEWRGGSAVITEVRIGSPAERAGLRAGMRIVSFNKVAIEEATRSRIGKSLRKVDEAARNWALRRLLAGRRNEPRSLVVVEEGQPPRTIDIDERQSAAAASETKSLLDYRLIGGGRIGYIRINNSLGDTELIKQFDDALAALKDTRGLILDLRDTPSGGNTTVGRGLMGRFIEREMPYQKHSIPAEERRYGTKRSWLELVSPRGAFIYRAPVVVLVNHWTGSMGEGIAIGFDGMKRATVVGTEMAGLIGATSGIRLPHMGIGMTFPTEKLFHVGGTPREKFVPPVYVDLLKSENRNRKDAIFETGLTVLEAATTKARRKARP